MTITKAQAAREINRRKGNLAVMGGKTLTEAQARALAVKDGTFGLLKPDLKAIAGRARAQVQAQAQKAPAVKAPKAKNPHTALRQQAWDWRAAEYRAGRKHTVAEAYAKFGTQHAANDPK